jgi:hypothetical protein
MRAKLPPISKTGERQTPCSGQERAPELLYSGILNMSRPNFPEKLIVVRAAERAAS